MADTPAGGRRATLARLAALGFSLALPCGRTAGAPAAAARPARRVVCLLESALSNLYMLGAGEAIVGVPAAAYDASLFPAYAALDARISRRQLPAPGDWNAFSPERVLALSPDLVVAWGEQREAIAFLEKRGIPVCRVFIDSLAALEQSLRELGRLTGTAARAETLIAEAATVRRVVVGRVPASAPRSRVHFAWAAGVTETACRESIVNELIALAGGHNLCQAPREHGSLNLEQIIAADPEVVILWHGAAVTPERLYADRRWQGVRAVRARRVHRLPPVFECDLWTPKYEAALALFQHWCHPDIAPGEAHDRARLMQRLYGRVPPLAA